MDDRKSLSIAFLAISDQYATFFFTIWLPASGHFGWPKITFDRISHHFRSIRNFCFCKMAAGGYFGWPKITFDRISRHFRSIRNFNFLDFSTKRLPVAILDDRKSRSIAFLAISDQYATLIFFHKMAAGGHFGLLKITFDRISRHFRSICTFFFFKMACSGDFGSRIWAILDDRKSLSIAFLAISDQYATYFVLNVFFSKWQTAAILEVPFGPFWMTENHFRSHFSPFQINTQLFLFESFFKILEVRFAPKTIGFFHYVLLMAMLNMMLIGEFVTQLEMPQTFWAFLYKMAARGHFVFSIDDTNHRVIVIWDFNGYGEYEFVGVFVTKLWPVQALACGGGDGGATKNIISPKFSNFGDIIK